MYCINHRIGILYRQNLAKKSYQLRYFFIDDECNLFYISSLPRIQKAIRLSKNIKQIKTKLLKLGQRSLDLNKYIITPPKQYTGQAVIPFSNRVCFQIKDKELKAEEKVYQIFGLADEDTGLIYQEILYLTGKTKRNINKKTTIPQKQQSPQKKSSNLFQTYLTNSSQFSMPANPNQPNKPDNQYEGQRKQGLASGRGRQILISKGMTYTGEFLKGKKHGTGYLVNQHLDTLECQFIGDELVGI